MLMLMLVVFLLGTISLGHLSLELLPRFQPPVLAVYTSWGDSSPQEVSTMITEPLEGVVATISGLKSLTSVSSEGSSVIICEFAWGSNLDAIRDEIKERLGFVPIPEDAAQPLVLRFDPTSMPGLRISVSGDVTDERLEEVVNTILIRNIENVQGVASVDLSGLQPPEIRVLLGGEQMLALGINQMQVVQAIQAGNVVMPAGTVTDDDLEANVRVLGQLEDVEDLRNIILGAFPLGFLTLGQVAEVEDGWAPRDSIVRTNGEPAVILAVRKEGDANLVQVNQAVLKRIEQLDSQLQDVDLIVTMNQAEFIQDSIASIGQNLLIGAGLAVLALLVFLQSPLSTLVIAVSIPFSVISTFVLMDFSGLTLNIMSLGGLALGVGMMVDNSIVVIENIFRHLQQGLSADEAATRGTDEVAGAITASTLTTLAVFLPVVYVGGMTGELFRELAWTVSFALLTSLLVAVTVIPMLASKILPLGKQRNALKPRPSTGRYARAIGWALGHRLLVLGAVGLLVAASALPFSRLGREFLPAIDEGSFNINLTMPVGTPLEITAGIAEEIEQMLANNRNVSVFSTRVGGSSGMDMSQLGKNTASIDVRLVPTANRSQDTDAVMAWARREAEKLLPRDATVSVQRQDQFSTMAGSSSLQVNVRGASLDRVQDLAAELRDRLAELPGLAEVTSSLDERLPEQQVIINRRKAAAVGLAPAQIALQVNAALTGQVATRLSREGNHVEVKVLSAGIDTSEDLHSLMLATLDGRMVPLGAVAEIRQGHGPMTLHRDDQQITARITAVIEDGDLGDISNKVDQIIAEMDWPGGYGASLGGAGQMMQEGFESLYLALGLAIVLVYVVMAALFESLLHPLVIILTLPLAAVGAILALFFSQYALGITAMIGIIMLAGIVVNNAIVMVDAINQLRDQGMATKEAIITGAGMRLRPILMTAFTTILAMLPLALGVGEGAELQAPLATAVIGGLLTATILTLLVAPVVYSFLAGKR
jgi:HAE1 family hydrophobic/amphiphilic exporter-1